jgi:hypothetical protein
MMSETFQGLGTSTAKEGKEYFRDLSKHKKDFHWESQDDGDAIEMAFSKKKVEARKTWLRHYEVVFPIASLVCACLKIVIETKFYAYFACCLVVCSQGHFWIKLWKLSSIAIL